MKVRRISDFQSRFYFPSFDNHLVKHLEVFNQTSLGHIHKAIPWDKLAKALKLKEYK